jgi:guanine deaminase
MLAAIQHAAIAAKVTSFTDTSEYAEGKYAKQPLSLPSLVHLATLGGAAVCNLDS